MNYLRALWVILLIAICNPALAQYSLQFVGSKLGPQDQTGTEGTHAFMIIGVPTRTGIKEEAFGFYPKQSSDGQSPGLVQMIIGHPGAMQSEFRRNPDRLAVTANSFTMNINEEQRRAIYQDVVRWNEHTYRLTNENCMNFLDSIARDVGLTPPSGTHLAPSSYVAALEVNYNRKQESDRNEQLARRREQEERERQLAMTPKLSVAISENTDRPQFNLQVNAGLTNVPQCQAMCVANQSCRAFVVRKAGAVSPGCYLKSQLDSAIATSCCTTGVVTRP